MRNLNLVDQDATTTATTKNGTAVTTKTKYRDFNDFLGRKQSPETQQMKNGQQHEVDKTKPKVPYSSYKEFLENYNTKKFSSVRPAIPTSTQDANKTMKSEIFIQVNGDSERATKKPVVLINGNGNAKKMFTTPPPPPPQFPEIKPSPMQKVFTPPPPPPPFENKRTITKTSVAAPPPPPPPGPEFLEAMLKKRAAALQKTNNEINTTTYVPVIDERDGVDKNDPNVKKLVYNTYRGLLGAYNNKANDIVSTLPRHCVREDRGIAKQLESIA